jgi:hypothetical protein
MSDVATPPKVNQEDQAIFLKSSGQVPALYTKMAEYRDSTELAQANNLLDNLDKVQDVFQLQTAQFQDQMLLGDQFFGTSATPVVRNEVQERNQSLVDQKASLEASIKKSIAKSEQMNRDFEDEKAALPETLTTSVIHVLDDYTLVVLMISYIFMILAFIFVYTSINGYSISSIFKAVGFSFFISILLFIIAAIVL